jgi:hypothetical protein
MGTEGISLHRLAMIHEFEGNQHGVTEFYNPEKKVVQNEEINK